MKRRLQSNPIHINGLPENLVEKILTCLPIQDAVRTSVLSKKWRYAWTKLTELEFNDKFCDQSIINTKSKLIMAIYQVLLLHRGPLLVFTISLANLGSGSEIDQFVLTVLQKGVERFKLFMPMGGHYILPSSIFAYAQQLVHLELRSCLFKPQLGFKGFSKLESLVLLEVGIDGNNFSSLISNCPLLEIIYFESSRNCGGIDIDTPNLEFFSFEGLCKSLCFKNTPKLNTIQISTREDINNDALKEIEATTQVTLCGRLPVVEDLRLDQFYSKHVTANRDTTSLLNELCHVETLHLWGFCFGILDEFVSALCMTKNSTNIENLTINMSTKDNTLDTKFKEMVGFSDIMLDHLREVKLQNVCGFKCEMQFIELILAKSPVLETIIIQPTSELVGDKEVMFLIELARLRRASPFVEVLYKA